MAYKNINAMFVKSNFRRKQSICRQFWVEYLEGKQTYSQLAARYECSNGLSSGE